MTALWGRLRAKYRRLNAWLLEKQGLCTAARLYRRGETIDRQADEIDRLQDDLAQMRLNCQALLEYHAAHFEKVEAKDGLPFAICCGLPYHRHEGPIEWLTFRHKQGCPKKSVSEQPHVAFIESVLAESYESPYPPVSVPNLEGESQ